jgi:hypothetical protein
MQTWLSNGELKPDLEVRRHDESKYSKLSTRREFSHLNMQHSMRDSGRERSSTLMSLRAPTTPTQSHGHQRNHSLESIKTLADEDEPVKLDLPAPRVMASIPQGPPLSAAQMHVYTVKTFAAKTLCSQCNSELTGQAMQGKQCQGCNSAVHNRCYAYAMASPCPHTNRKQHKFSPSRDVLKSCAWCERRIGLDKSLCCSACGMLIHQRCEVKVQESLLLGMGSSSSICPGGHA